MARSVAHAARIPVAITFSVPIWLTIERNRQDFLAVPIVGAIFGPLAPISHPLGAGHASVRVFAGSALRGSPDPATRSARVSRPRRGRDRRSPTISANRCSGRPSVGCRAGSGDLVALHISILLASVGPVPAGATTGGLRQDATEHLPRGFAALRRACPGGITTLQATCVPTQSLLPPGQARRRARYLASLGSQPVVIPPGQARRKSHGLVRNNEVGRPAHSEVSHD